MTAIKYRNGMYRIGGRMMRYRRAIQYAASKGERTLIIVNHETNTYVETVDVYMMR